ncbi:MAG: type IX secretion system membrane protein PorP/SprF [Saprospiraceae bacterium]
MRIFILLLSLLGMAGMLQAQDPLFSQFYAAPLQINPAFAGVTYAPRVTFNYRSQWAQIEGGYQTYAAAYEQSIPRLNSGLGLMLSSDDAMNGVYKTTRISAVYSYGLQVKEDFFMKFGVEAGMIGTRLDWERLQFVDQLDPLTGGSDGGGNPIPSEEQMPASLNNNVLDISAGLLMYTKILYGGISVKHINNPDDSFLSLGNNLAAGMPIRITVHGGAEIEVKKGNNRNPGAFISPNILIARQAAFTQVNVGAYSGFGRFFGGVWYRHAGKNPDAAIILAGFREGALRIGYSYDLTMSKLANVSPGGTHEISLTINFDDSREAQRRRKSARYNDCFKMFK